MPVQEACQEIQGIHGSEMAEPFDKLYWPGATIHMSAVQQDWQALGFPSAAIAELWEMISQPSTAPKAWIACFQAMGQCIATNQVSPGPSKPPQVQFMSLGQI